MRFEVVSLWYGEDNLLEQRDMNTDLLASTGVLLVSIHHPRQTDPCTEVYTLSSAGSMLGWRLWCWPSIETAPGQHIAPDIHGDAYFYCLYVNISEDMEYIYSQERVSNSDILFILVINQHLYCNLSDSKSHNIHKIVRKGLVWSLYLIILLLLLSSS